MINYQLILDKIHSEIQPLLSQGKVANYIPELAKVPRSKFGMALLTLNGDIVQVGDASDGFSIQSISKLFSLTLAMRNGADKIWKRVGREPSGTAFNSLVQLEYENGIPRNPFINAGALVITDMILSDGDPHAVLNLLQKLSGNRLIQYDLGVASSEQKTGYRNAAMANFIKSFGNLQHEPEQVLEAYFRNCSIAMSCVDLAYACGFLANAGRHPPIAEKILEPNGTKYVNALMQTCGTYDAVGDFAYRVGLPSKSGVGGGIVAVMPGEFSVCVWSPGLDEHGNSLAGTKALELLTTYTSTSIF